MKRPQIEYYTYVKVDPIIRDFYMSVNKGSDTLNPTKHDQLWQLVKINLKCVPQGINPMPKDNCFLRIALLSTREFMREYRHFLDFEGQYYVRKYLTDAFRDIFHNYVLGSVSAGQTQIESVRSFIQDYKLNPDTVKLDSLMKSWKRSPQYEMWKN
jgi:hypothetical protein